MNVVERREKIMRIMYRRRYETIENLARECEVSTRTILRDINKMMNIEPIYTQSGRYGGGVYIVEGSTPNILYLKDNEINLMIKILEYLESLKNSLISEKERFLFREIIVTYTKPKIKK